MLFSTRPKEKKQDLYNRDKEVEMIKDSISRNEWIAVLGMRRIGKTSVANVAVNESGFVRIKVDLKTNCTKEEFLSILSQAKAQSTDNKVILVIDNAQYLPKIAGVQTPSIFHNLYDNYTNVSVVLVGVQLS